MNPVGDNPGSTELTTQKPTAKPRRAPTPRNAERRAEVRSGIRLPDRITLILVLAALAVGVALGGYIQRRRQYARQVIVSINGTNIDQSAFYGRLENAAGMAVMKQMVLETLQIQFAKKLGLLPSNEEVEQRYADYSKTPQFEQLIKSGQTPGDIKRILRIQMAQVNVLTQGVQVSDDEIRRYYQQNIDPRNPQAQFRSPEYVRLAVIQTKTLEDCNTAAQELASGAPFGTVATNHSILKFKVNGREVAPKDGVLPPFVRGQKPFVPLPVSEASLFHLKINDQLPPTKAGNSWWIIRCVDRKSAWVEPFDKAKDECRKALALKQALATRKDAVEKQFADFAKNSVKQPFWPRYEGALQLSN